MEQHGFAVQFEPGPFAVIFGHGAHAADQGDLGRSGNDDGDMIRVGYRLQGLMGMKQANQEEKGEGREGETEVRGTKQGQSGPGARR